MTSATFWESTFVHTFQKVAGTYGSSSTCRHSFVRIYLRTVRLYSLDEESSFVFACWQQEHSFYGIWNYVCRGFASSTSFYVFISTYFTPITILTWVLTFERPPRKPSPVSTPPDFTVPKKIKSKPHEQRIGFSASTLLATQIVFSQGQGECALWIKSGLTTLSSQDKQPAQPFVFRQFREPSQ